jgi:surfeit locus 1 family protein
LLGAAVLLWLGFWQVDRLGQKEAILSAITATIDGAPEPLPVLVDPEAQRYQPVALEGRFGDAALFVLVSVKRQGAGWRVISPFTTSEGRLILVDRGFTPVAQKTAPQRDDSLRLTGNLHWPDDRTAATPENDPAGNIWYARDIGAMAEALQTEPLLVIARAVSPPDEGLTPLPVSTEGIPNDHLHYAATWFSLAAVWLLMTGVWIWRRHQGKD